MRSSRGLVEAGGTDASVESIRVRWIAFFGLLSLAFCAFADLRADAKRAYSQIIREVDVANIRSTLSSLYRFQRVGYLGEDAKSWLRSATASFGPVIEEPFDLTLPAPDATGRLTVSGKSSYVYPLWPNGVRTSTCDIYGRLIYAGDGEISRFNGQAVKDSIVILDFNSGQAWLTAARLGAKAAIFLAPKETTRAEAEAKWSQIPLNFPRFYADKTILSNVNKLARLTCSQNWTDVRASNFIFKLPGSDPKLKREWVVVSAYFDTVSVVPGLPHGADQSAGATALLELARLFQKRQTKRSVLFVLTTAHFQAMQGIRAFIENRFRDGWKISDGETPQAFFALDLSTRSGLVAALARGWWLDYRDENAQQQQSIARALRERAPDIAEVMRETEGDVFFDGVNNPDGRAWQNNVPGRIAVESEIATIGGMNGITFATAGDARMLQDTPLDTIARASVGNLTHQVRVLACLFYHLFNDTQDETQTKEFTIPYRGARNLVRMSLIGGYGTITGRVLSYDPRKSFLPDVPMTDALVQISNKYKTYMGVRGLEDYRAKGKDAQYSIFGVPLITIWPESQRRWVAVSAFRLDNVGNITHAMDFGIRGAGQFETEFEMNTSYRKTPVVVFQCKPIEIYGLTDPNQLKSLIYLRALDAISNGPASSFSFYSTFATGTKLQSFVENSAMVFALPGSKIKMFAGGLYGNSAAFFTNSNSALPAGVGFAVDNIERIENTALASAKDIWNLNDWRAKTLAKHNIVNQGLDQLQKLAANNLERAQKALDANDYSNSEKYARAAWGFSLRAQPEYRKITDDILYGLVFYMALLLPFSYFLERLLIASSSLSRQLFGSAAIFVASFLLLRVLHPAFDITENSFMIFVAFTIGALSLIVITFIIGKFETGLQKLQREAEGVHEGRTAKLSLAATALAIGISNMRRRRARTFLTCATLVIVTFIVLSFTSIVTDLRFNEVPAAGKAAYPGILLRNVAFDAIEDSAYRSLRTEFEPRGVVARRAWFFGAEIGAQSVLQLAHGDKKANINALLGLDSQEARITAPQNALLGGGKWFDKNALNEVILPRSLADRLGIAEREVGKTTVEYGGIELKVAGIADDGRLKAIVDLDNESLLPADFGLSQRLQDKGLGGDYAFRKYVRYDSSTVCIVPAAFAVSLGADIRSVAVSFPSFQETAAAMKEMMPRTALNLYAAVPGDSGPEVRKFSSVASSKGKGFELVLIPVLIAIVIVLNTMITSVLERTREIGTLSAVGLSPKNIAALFFAESIAHAVIGVVFGYFVAQATSVVINRLGLSGFSLNYSSLSAMISTGIVVGVVLVSTIYPARIAKRIATPAGSEEWYGESPLADDWNIRLPFTVTKAHASALSKFYAEWFSAYQEYTIGEFVTEGVASGESDDTFFAESRCWLSPFDLGVQQILRLQFEATDMADVYSVSLHIRRISGDPESWESLNKRFLKSIRQQFLIWRTLSREQKAAYLS